MSEAARFFQALGDETRLALLGQLRDGGKTVGALVSALGCPQPKVSRHLKVLKDVGLVRDRKSGRHVTYELSAPARWGPDARQWWERLRPASAGRPTPRKPRPPRTTPPPTPPPPEVEPVERRQDIETYLL